MVSGYGSGNSSRVDRPLTGDYFVRLLKDINSKVNHNNRFKVTLGLFCWCAPDIRDSRRRVRLESRGRSTRLIVAGRRLSIPCKTRSGLFTSRNISSNSSDVPLQDRLPKRHRFSLPSPTSPSALEIFIGLHTTRRVAGTESFRTPDPLLSL